MTGAHELDGHFPLQPRVKRQPDNGLGTLPQDTPGLETANGDGRSLLGG